MAITTQQISERLLKKSAGVSETGYPLTTKPINEEAIPTYSVVSPNDIWLDAGLISGNTPTNPVMVSGETYGVIKYFDKLQLIQASAGSNVSFKSPNSELMDAISQKFGYDYKFRVFGYNNVEIFKGSWMVDAEAGVLIFYNPTENGIEATVDATHIPKISFYKYIGRKGLVAGPTGSTINNVAVFNSVDGKLISDSGIKASNLTGLTSNIQIQLNNVTGNTSSGYTHLETLIYNETTGRTSNDAILQNRITGLTANKLDISGGTITSNLLVNGNVTGNTFYGNGSGLTGITASGIVGLELDRISSTGDTYAVMYTTGLTVNTGITATSFIKTGNSPGQFLMADGSTITTGDTISTYDARYINVTGDTVNGTINSTPYITENFETGVFGSNFTSGGTAGWSIASGVVFGSVYSAKSGIILDNQFSDLIYTFNSIYDVNYLTFKYYLSSEINFDVLLVLVDGVPYSRCSVNNLVTIENLKFYGKGNKVITFRYYKDSNTTISPDNVFIDDINIFGVGAFVSDSAVVFNDELFVSGKTKLNQLIISKDIELYDDAFRGGFKIGMGPTNGYPRNTSNVSIGSNTFTANTTGIYDVAIGPGALENNTTGTYNIAIGTAALQLSKVNSFNLGVGVQSGARLTGGTSNSFLGYHSALNLLNGDKNVAIGAEAGFFRPYFLTGGTYTGTGLTFLGSFTAPNPNVTTNLINSTAIGYQAEIDKSNQVVLGGTGVTETILRGNVITSGNISGNTFYGDGSMLTGINAGSPDRIVSTGSTSAIMYTTGLTVNTGITATSFKTPTGTTNQFLKANGDVDNKTYITAADVPTQLITENIPVSLSNNKTLGKYTSGQIIDVGTGMTVTQLFKDIALEALAPSITLSSPTTIAFNQTGITNVLNFSYIINSLASTVDTVSLEWRRNGSGTWTGLTTDTGLTAYTHVYTDINFNVQPFNYRYIVTDKAGGTATSGVTITPAAYLAPTITITSIGNLTRDLGNINTTVAATVTRRSINVPIASYKIQQSINGGSYTDITTGATATSGGTISYVDNNISLINSTSIAYRVIVVDSYQTTTGSTSTINFYHRKSLGYSTGTTIGISDITGFTNFVLSNSTPSTEITIPNVLCPTTDHYTYYAYKYTYGDLIYITQSPSTPTLGNWTKLTDITGTNQYGATVTYRIYKTNQPGSFNSTQTLIIK